MPSLKSRVKNATLSQQHVVKLYPPPKSTWDISHKEYRYKLTGFPIQNDPVIRFMRQTINQLSKEYMLVAAVSYRVEALTNNPTIWPLDAQNKHLGHKMYVIKRCFDEFPYSVAVTIKQRHDTSPLTVERLMVRVDKDSKPQPFQDFLVEMSEEHNGHPGLGPYQAQYKWWSRRGAPFRLLDLPYRIRQKIFVHALGTNMRPHIAPYWMRETQVVLGSIQQNPDWDRRHELYRKSGRAMVLKDDHQYEGHPNYAIFRVSKQICREAEAAGWNGTSKFFHSLSTLSRVLRFPSKPTQPEALSKIVLEMDFTQYFDMFGF